MEFTKERSEARSGWMDPSTNCCYYRRQLSSNGMMNYFLFFEQHAIIFFWSIYFIAIAFTYVSSFFFALGAFKTKRDWWKMKISEFRKMAGEKFNENQY